ncbi:GtrA family protein [Patescibacteria group bacterium]|nr:GtrA family protein [Patescibacteria group bacterium]
MAQLWRFTLVGAGATMIDFCVYLALTKIFDLHYLLANFVSMSLGAIFGFWFNKKYTFQDTDARVVRQYLKFWLNAFLMLAISEVLLLIGVRYLGLWDVLVKIAVFGIIYFINFFFQRTFIFRRRI